jgi:large repetitive protein
VNLWTVPADVSVPVTPDGTAVMSSTTVPRQDIRLTFNGAAGDKIAVRVNGVTRQRHLARIDDLLRAQRLFAPAEQHDADLAGNRGRRRREVPGAEEARLNGDVHGARRPGAGPVLSSVTVAVWIVPTDASGPIVADGTAASSSTATPGQDARLTFSGNQGDRVSLKVQRRAAVRSRRRS